MLVFYSNKTYETAVKSDVIFFTSEKNGIGDVIGHMIFFTCKENRITSRIASQKKSHDPFSKRLSCVNLSAHYFNKFMY